MTCMVASLYGYKGYDLCQTHSEIGLQLLTVTGYALRAELEATIAGLV